MIYACVVSHSVISDSFWPHGLQPTRLLCPWNFPSKNAGVSCHALLWGIFPTQRLNPGLLHCRWILCSLSQQGRWQIIFLPTHTNTHTHPLLVLFSLAFPSGDFPFLWTAWTNSRGSQIPGALDSQKLSLVIPKMQWVPFSQFGFSKSGMGLRNTALHTLSGGSHQFSCL